jgi:hypothetical protein
VVQVTKLCDLSPGDSVCSVSWSQRGTYLSVGTNSGEVQVSTETAEQCICVSSSHRGPYVSPCANLKTQEKASRDAEAGSLKYSPAVHDVLMLCGFSCTAAAPIRSGT